MIIISDHDVAPGALSAKLAEDGSDCKIPVEDVRLPKTGGYRPPSPSTRIFLGDHFTRYHGRCGAGHVTGAGLGRPPRPLAAQGQWLPTDRPAIGVAERDRK
jgi:hypothetical protein